MCAVPLGADGGPSSTPTIATDDKGAACYETVRGPDDPIQGALAGTVAIVKEMFSVRIINGDDGELQDPIPLHAP